MIKSIEEPCENKNVEEKKKIKLDDIIWDLPNSSSKTRRESKKSSPQRGMSIQVSRIFPEGSKTPQSPLSPKIDRILLKKLEKITKPALITTIKPSEKLCLSTTLQESLIRLNKNKDFLLRSRSGSNQKIPGESKINWEFSPATPLKKRVKPFISPKNLTQQGSPRPFGYLHSAMRVDSLQLSATTYLKSAETQ